MSDTVTPMNVAERTPSASQEGQEGQATATRNNDFQAAGALNIVRKRPVSGSPSADALAPGLPSTPDHNLIFRGGKTIPNLTYQNLYVGGQTAWAVSDIQNIDRALAAVMTDARLNTVINQYFGGQTVSTTAAPSQTLPGPKPKRVSRANISALVQKQIVKSGLLNRFDPTTTVFNFLLPRGCILTTDGGVGGSQTDEAPGDMPSVTTVTTIRSGSAITTVTVSTTTVGAGGTPQGDGDTGDPADSSPVVDPDDAASSLNGLGGYHGSVHAAGKVVYFAVSVFSEILANGSENGIVAFDQSWKNLVATLYHELQEARTDPDVEDAIRTNNNNFIGWNSAQGEEIGDFPVFEANPLQQVFREVPLLAGGTAPVQLVYSNRVNGPEDPTI